MKAVLWRRYYAEQLRCWGLWMQATELENVPSHFTTHVIHEGVIPVQKTGGRRATCSICYSVIDTLEQLCPACLHTTHLECLEGYVGTLHKGETFRCTTGCGCACLDLPFEPVEFATVVGKEEQAKLAGGVGRRKPSFTDPTMWRERVEGNSW